MYNTLIVYQYPIALPDIYKWAAENRFELKHSSEKPIYYVSRENEEIWLMPMVHVATYRCIPDKLVLWGEFKKHELIELSERL